MTWTSTGWPSWTREVIVTQDLCEVCAVAYDAVGAATEWLAGRNVQVVNMHS